MENPPIRKPLNLGSYHFALKRYQSIILLFAVLLTACKGTTTKTPEKHAVLADACTWLWAQQAEDGGWHSDHHGFLKGGQAWTPFVLHALLQVPDSVYSVEPANIDKAFQFIISHLIGDSVLGLHDPDILEYPNYATAYALQAMATYDPIRYQPYTEKMADYLARQQFDSYRGMEPSHVAFGGWGFGETRLQPGETGHLDLSHTRRVLQALSMLEEQYVYERAKAQSFLAMCQKWPADPRPQPGMLAGGNAEIFDGGFYYSPVIEDANKGKRLVGSTQDEWYFQSYATATCDGVLALLASGVALDDKRLSTAIDWLENHSEMAFPEGIPQDDVNQWHEVMKYYHLCVRSEAFAAIGVSGPWKAQIQEILADGQAADGSFANPHGKLNKEDDPVMCTALAIIAAVNSAE